MIYRVTEDADADLESIADYIAQFNPVAAAGLIKRLQNRFELIGSEPELGRLRPDLRSQLRSLSHGRYTIYYVVEDDGVPLILRVIHGARDIARVLRHTP